jgi:hypothetical protein
VDFAIGFSINFNLSFHLGLIVKISIDLLLI